MPNELSQTTRRVVLGIVLVAALLFIVAMPSMTINMINKIDTGLYNSIEVLKQKGRLRAWPKQQVVQWQYGRSLSNI